MSFGGASHRELELNICTGLDLLLELDQRRDNVSILRLDN